MKPEVVFGLESAAWPSLLVNASGLMLRANTTATAAFGAVLGSGGAHLSSVWAPENGAAVEQFLAQWEQSPTSVMNLKFRTAFAGTVNYLTAICTFSREGQKWFVLQLLPVAAPSPALAATPAASAMTTPAPPAAAPAETKAVLDAGGIVLKQKLDCALQLARTVSLDFNNALTSVLGHTSLLLGKAEPGHPWRHSLLEVEKSAARAAEISNELAVFSRQEKETRKVPPGNLNTVINRCVDFFRNANGAKITWNLQLEKGLFGARFDEAKIQQALTKILENAVEAVGAGGQVAVQTRNVDLSEPTQDRNVRLAAGAYICAEIADNGAGIEPEVLVRIFEPFFTTKGKTHRGLGLALAYGIVSNHGGGVAISSQAGAGASARVYLPAEKDLIRDNFSGVENLHGTETVLVVDDEGMVLTMADTILTEFGYKVLMANGGQKALAILSRDDTKVDLVITDLVMPGMGGRELVERIRQLTPAMKILCTSGYAMPADKQTGTEYLQKPFTSRDLLAKVKHLLAGAVVIDG